MGDLKYKRVLVKLSGEALAGEKGFGIDPETCAVICQELGTALDMGAQMALADAGISLYAGVQGSADAAAKALAEGTLEYDPNARCDHHDHHEHHDGECGRGRCAEHDCSTRG